MSSVNFVSNVAVVSSGLAIRATGLGEADYAVGSLKELNQIEEDLGVAVDFAKEAAKNPGKVIHAAGSAVQEYAGRLASGDTRAIAQTSAFVTELVIDVATGNAAKKGAEALGEMGEAVAEQSVKQSKKARKASVLVEGKKTPKTAPKKVKAPDSPGGGSKGPTPGSQKYAAKDAQIQKQVRRAELDQKFGRSGDINADICSSRGYSKPKAVAENALDLTSELSRSGDRARASLRRSLGLKRGDLDEAHHLIPLELTGHELVIRAARAGFNFNSEANGVAMSFARHRGVNIFHHNKYNRAIRSVLDGTLNNTPDIGDSQAADFLFKYTNSLREGIKRSNGRLK